MRRRSVLTSLACVVALLLAAPAVADDGSVERAWDADDASYMKLGKRFGKEVQAWKARQLRGVGGLLRVSRATRRLLRHTRERVTPEEPSSTTGAAAKHHVLLSIESFSRSFRLLERGLRLGARSIRLSAHRRRGAVRLARRADALLRRSDRVYRRSYRQAQKGKELFRQAERERAEPGQGPGPRPEPPAPPRPCLLAPVIC